MNSIGLSCHWLIVCHLTVSRLTITFRHSWSHHSKSTTYVATYSRCNTSAIKALLSEFNSGLMRESIAAAKAAFEKWNCLLFYQSLESYFLIIVRECICVNMVWLLVWMLVRLIMCCLCPHFNVKAFRIPLRLRSDRNDLHIASHSRLRMLCANLHK